MSAIKKQVGGNHYKDMVIQPGVFCQANQLNYFESLAIKYICRHKSKNGLEDIEKAIHCLELIKDTCYLTETELTSLFEIPQPKKEG